MKKSLRGQSANWMVGVGGVFVGLSLVATSAFAATTSKDLIVRYREPQNNRSQAIRTALATAGSVTQADVLNATEGVVKLEFATPEQADLARARLELNADVVNVAPNYLYKPAVKYRFHKVAQREATPKPFLALPFESLASGNLPEVLLPPASVTPGVDPVADRDWALQNIHMPAFSSLGSDGSSVVAAVIDTGVDYNHEDLVGAMWRNPENAKEVGYDFAHNSAQPYDVVKFDIEGCLKDLACRLGINQGQFLANPGHGTHCAGHVGAVANNSIGMRGVGSAHTQVMGLKFFYDAGEEYAGQGDDAAAIKSIDYAVNHGAKVISASWGGRMSREEAEKSELKQALIRAQKAGVLVVVAAGNDGEDQDASDQPSYPAAYDLDNLIVVAASDKDDKLADFSNYGGKSVHIAAPGVKILSTTVGSQYSDLIAKFKDSQGGEQAIDWDGTSMATPIVAGAVALVWSKNPTASYHEIRDLILKSARKVPALQGKVTTGAVLDVSAALGMRTSE